MLMNFTGMVIDFIGRGAAYSYKTFFAFLTSYGFLGSIYGILCLFIILLVMVQKGHGGLWSGPSSNESTAVLGGSGGADILQKITWACGFILIISSFSLTLYRNKISQTGKYASAQKEIATESSVVEEKNDVNDTTDTNNETESLEKEIVPKEKNT